jgi:hypothetical protein
MTRWATPKVMSSTRRPIYSIPHRERPDQEADRTTMVLPRCCGSGLAEAPLRAHRLAEASIKGEVLHSQFPASATRTTRSSDAWVSRLLSSAIRAVRPLGDPIPASSESQHPGALRAAEFRDV